MTQLRVYKKAVVEFSDDDMAALSVLMTEVNRDGEVVTLPPDFPLKRAQVVFNGANATISVEESGRKHRRVCRLTEAKLTEPRNDNDPIVVEGTSSELLANGFSAQDSRIKATITKYATCATCR